jgi:hypothetical protein
MKWATISPLDQIEEGEPDLAGNSIHQHNALAVTAKRNIADIGAYSTQMIKGWGISEGPQLLLPFDPNRQGARLICGEAVDSQVGTSLSATGTATTPAAGAPIASLNLPAGTYTLSGMVRVFTAVGTSDNVALFVNGVNTGDAILLQVATGPAVAIPAFTVTLTAPGTVSLNVIGVDTGAYKATLIATPVGVQTSAFIGVYVGKRRTVDNYMQQGSLTGGGAVVLVGTNIPITNNEELYGAPIGVPDSGSFISIINEKWRDINAI